MPQPILRVRGLKTSFSVEGRIGWAVRGVDFDVEEGEFVGIVGESGSGKSVTALSLLRLIPEPPGRIAEGRVELRGRDVLSMSWTELRAVRGREIAMIFQEPMTSLNPLFSVGMQIAESAQIHLGLDRAQARARAVQMLTAVAVPDAERRLDDFPHQFSGGMRQRVMIAMALLSGPQILIADEPTTALDVTIQAQIIELIQDLQRQRGMAVLWITHDLSVVAETCDRVLVMYGGRIQEAAPVVALFEQPLHPYTRALLASIPERATPGAPLPVIKGNVPSIFGFPAGCTFASRCPLAEPRCRAIEPELVTLPDGHQVRCHLVDAGDPRPPAQSTHPRSGR